MPFICGLDEVGRGALAGPMFAVAAMFRVPNLGPDIWDIHRSNPIEGVKDSKAFSTHKARTEVFHRILRYGTLEDFGIGHVSVEEINEKGIDEANRIAFYRAWKDMCGEPDLLLVDGDRPAPAFNYSKQKNAPKADAKWWPVSAASVLAKVIRDNYMTELGADFPHFLWGQNSGYGSKDHRNALRSFGPSPLHRQQFISKILGTPHEK